MQFDRLTIPDLIVVTPFRNGDARGWLAEIFREDLFQTEVPGVRFVQHNQSHSRLKGTVRGLHFQIAPRAQGKLVHCPRGRVLDIAVDLRRSSRTFGQHVAVELSAETGQLLWIPAGFAHGFCTLEDACDIAYATTDTYSAAHDRGLFWNDPALGIDWPFGEDEAILSEKDKAQPRLAALDVVFD